MQKETEMDTHFYLSVFPTQAMIASQLTPEQFGAYMSTGAKNGSYEQLIFIEVEGGFGSYFDWKYANERCVTHEDGRPKNSVWLSVYRSLEHTPFSAMKAMYLTTRDGRVLELNKSDYSQPDNKVKYFVYNELCPIEPLVVSVLDPKSFGEYMTDTKNKIAVPSVVFADLKTIDLDDPTNTGNIGATYDRNLEHLKNCVEQVLNIPDKKNKNIERHHVENFSYQIINRGIYLSTAKEMVFYPMPSVDELRQNNYDWARSAMIL
jgi:hypothetical protein